MSAGFRANAITPFVTLSPILVLQGGNDTQVPPDSVEELVDVLRLAGMRIELQVFPEAGHDVAAGFLAQPPQVGQEDALSFIRGAFGRCGAPTLTTPRAGPWWSTLLSSLFTSPVG
mmetsp:Transcript_36238/g.114325  ORF Transcript_36238/g.114325 Transcript_36238/m.114325 type:complete len:116 (+) Transcript_36238:439-786(+)